MTIYTVRQVKPEEIKVALDLALRVFMEFEAPVYEKEAVSKFIADSIENEVCIDNYVSGRHLMLGAFDGERIIGLITERGNGHISMVFVDKAYHRQGVATAIMEKMVVSLKLQGFEKITINSSPYGLPFYHKFGFIDIYSEQKKDGFIFTPMQYTPKELWDVYNKDRIKIGKIVERGRTMAQDEYHIVVHVWIKNSTGEYLITKRSHEKPFCANMWECTGGSAVMGEDSITAAIREAKEELGVILEPQNGNLFNSYLGQHHDFPQFSDVWVFDADIPIENIILQEGETCDATWASKEKINKMIEDGEFIGRDSFPYIDELFKI